MLSNNINNIKLSHRGSQRRKAFLGRTCAAVAAPRGPPEDLHGTPRRQPRDLRPALRVAGVVPRGERPPFGVFSLFFFFFLSLFLVAGVSGVVAEGKLFFSFRRRTRLRPGRGPPQGALQLPVSLLRA